MAPGSRPESRLNLNYISQTQPSLPRSDSSTNSTSPIDPPPGTSVKSPFAVSNNMSASGSALGGGRLGAGSPLHDQATRLFPKRTRELQAQEGLSPGIWGPPTSGNSTPLRETIPESPTQDGFPDLIPPSESGLNSPARRARAGTVPSRFSPVGTPNTVNFQPSILSKTSRPTPSTSPFKPPSVPVVDAAPKILPPSSTNAALLSRLRAGSMPQRSAYLGSSHPFGSSLFSSNWGSSRDRTTTLTSIRSSEDPASPTQSSYSREGLTDTDVRTLDYLGLVETPQQPRAMLASPMTDVLMLQQQTQLNVVPQLLANYDLRNANRFRSYSVNATAKYEEDEEDEYGVPYSALQSGTLTPTAAATAAQLYDIQRQIAKHNMDVQKFAHQASAARPRARTAGILDTPPQHASLRSYLATPSRLENSISAADLSFIESTEHDNLANSVRLMQLNNEAMAAAHEIVDENDTQSSRALWIGSIPVSTTVTSLDAIFSRYGTIESTRVLTHKNCGFVNFENVENAVQARQLLNGKEIFPGAGPVRIGFAKAPNTPAPATSAGNIATSDPVPDPFTCEASSAGASKANTSAIGSGVNSPLATSTQAQSYATALRVLELSDLKLEMMQIVVEFGAADEDLQIISSSIDKAIGFQQFNREIPPIPEPSQTRMYDAPRLRDIRKRIDNNACSMQEIEETATGMLPEVAELASDYLGNTVVQKMFEFCSEQTKEQMLAQIAPHLAEIGVHKNGTWAAQKIIDVCRTGPQMTKIVTSLHPYTIPLFLDQYGNYVLQCCLRFGSPFNNFIFETMLSQMWEIAQGRFGARAMRACLESHHATKHQQRMLASAIALNGVQLATNTNGALLLTWFLDTCNFPQRRTVLAPRLVPQLVQLCTHKVAYLTVLKIINQRNEPEARDIILKALFFSAGDTVLEQILLDQTSGATLIFKVLTTPFFDENMRVEVVRNVSKVLNRIKAQPNHGYKRLMDEVGLSSRPVQPAAHHGHGHTHPNTTDRPRPMSQQGNASFMPMPNVERQFGGPFIPNMSAATFENGQGLTRSGSADSASFGPYALSGMNGPASFNQSPVQQITPQQLQYQAFLAASQRTNGNFMPGMTSNTFGYATPPPSMEHFRSMLHHDSPLTGSPQVSPMVSGSAFQQNFGTVMGGNVYGYQPQNLFPPKVPPMQGGGRRGRR